MAVATGNSHTVGLKSDGTVVAVGDNDRRQCNVSEWTDIAAVSAGDYRTVALKSNGRLVATGDKNVPRGTIIKLPKQAKQAMEKECFN